MEIEIHRASIAGESAADTHAVSFCIEKDTRFRDVFEALIRQGYFPQSAQRDGIWALWCCGDDVMAWHVRENVFYDRFPFGEPYILDGKAWKEPAIRFSFYPSALQRARHIFFRFGGEMGHIGHEGFMREYAGCHVPRETEAGWRRELR